jgi:hypothetical protein
MMKLVVAFHNSANAPKNQGVSIFSASYGLQNMVNGQVYFWLISLQFHGENHSICCCHSNVLNMTVSQYIFHLVMTHFLKASPIS